MADGGTNTNPRPGSHPMSNVVHLSSAVNSPDALSAAIEGLRDVVAAATCAVRGADSVDLWSAERDVHAALYRIEATALAAVMSATVPETDLVEVEGVHYKRMTSSSRGVYAGLHGTIEVWRPLYRQTGVRNGPTIDPVALRCGLFEGRFTPMASVAVAHIAQAVPTREGGELCESMGVLPYSRSGLYDLANSVGAEWEEQHVAAEEELMACFEVPEEASTVSVAADRITLPMAEDRQLTDRDKKRGIKRPITVAGRSAWVVCWTLHDAAGEPLWSTRYAHIPEAGRAELTSKLEGDLWWLKEHRPDLNIVTLADGAADVQGLVADATAPFEVKARLTDFYHLTEHLGEAARAVELEPNSTLERFVGALLTDDRAIEHIEEELLTWATAVDDELPDELYQALTYIDNQRERLRYASARRAGLPIGSGHVEATGKTIVTVRFKRSGARWRPATAQGLLSLRALATSSRWKPAMEIIVGNHATPVVEVTELRLAS